MSFLVYSTKLRQYVPDLAPEQAEDFVQQAWRDICNSNDEWTFLYAEDWWLAPASITLNGLQFVQFSTSVELGYSGMVLLAGLSNPAVTQRQLKVGVSAGPVYGISAIDTLQVTDGQINALSGTLQCLTSSPFSAGDVGKKIVVAGAETGGTDLETTITTYNAPNEVVLNVGAAVTVTGATVTWGSTLTLDRIYAEASTTNGSALCYRLYYSPSSTDFRRLDHLTDVILGYEFGWKIRPADDLDRMDPRRGSQNQPYQVFFRNYDRTSGLPIFELWPGPTTSRAYKVSYWRRGGEFATESETLPPSISEELLLTRARILAYEWAMVTDPDRNKRISYANGLTFLRSRYSTEGQPGRPLGLLEQAKLLDTDVYLKQFQAHPRTRSIGWPVDSNFMQNHAIPGWLG